MKTKTLRVIAVALGISVCGYAQAQSTYTSPAKWNNFRPVSDKAAAATEAVKAATEKAPELPAPTPDATTSTPVIESSPYQEAMACNCAPARLPLANYFGGANLLFLTLEESGKQVVTGLGSDFNTSVVRPDASVGFDFTVGRYLHNGQWGLGVTYMLWNPSDNVAIRTGTAGTIIPTNPGYNNIINGNTANDVYTDIQTSAEAVRLTRDVRFQGIEANLFGFGLMGARRVSRANCCPPAWATKYGRHLGCGCKGYGGATGPLARSCGGRLRVITSHGFRWFQIRDRFESAYNIDTVAGYQADDLYDDVDIENNLYGYQFGSRLTYCLSSRWSLNIGGKFGIYGNHARMRHRVGTLGVDAYRTGVPTDVINTESTDTTLATLGELDLGLGYRLGCAWTFRGGYRLFGVTGVANAVDSIPYNYSSVAASGQVHANDSYLLHGGYIGLEYNW